MSCPWTRYCLANLHDYKQATLPAVITYLVKQFLCYNTFSGNKIYLSFSPLFLALPPPLPLCFAEGSQCEIQASLELAIILFQPPKSLDYWHSYQAQISIVFKIYIFYVCILYMFIFIFYMPFFIFPTNSLLPSLPPLSFRYFLFFSICGQLNVIMVTSISINKDCLFEEGDSLMSLLLRNMTLLLVSLAACSFLGRSMAFESCPHLPYSVHRSSLM